MTPGRTLIFGAAPETNGAVLAGGCEGAQVVRKHLRKLAQTGAARACVGWVKGLQKSLLPPAHAIAFYYRRTLAQRGFPGFSAPSPNRPARWPATCALLAHGEPSTCALSASAPRPVDPRWRHFRCNFRGPALRPGNRSSIDPAPYHHRHRLNPLSLEEHP